MTPEERKHYNGTPQSRFARLRVSARKRDLPFALTWDDFESLCDLPCSYCGGPVERFGAGLDRIDNSKGYDRTNVLPSCGVCNQVRRGLFTDAEMRELGSVIRRIRAARAASGGPPLLMDYKVPLGPHRPR